MTAKPLIRRENMSLNAAKIPLPAISATLCFRGGLPCLRRQRNRQRIAPRTH
jgi:hypothetical protein